MSNHKRNWAIMGQLAEPRVRETVEVLALELQRRGLNMLVDAAEPGAGQLPGARQLPRETLLDQADLVLSVGGDGTLLQAAGAVAPRAIPLLGINRGRLGFLTDVLPQELAITIDAVLDGRCAEDRRALLAARVIESVGAIRSYRALNDVVMLRRETGRLLDFDTWVDGRQVNSHSGDGLVIATATGSTAYALSCGGPIVDPRLNVLVVAPICPHTLAERPIVIPGDSVVEARLAGRGEGRAELSCDASQAGEMCPGDRLEVVSSGEYITLLHPPGYDYFRLLRSKLHWGRGEQLPAR